MISMEKFSIKGDSSSWYVKITLVVVLAFCGRERAWTVHKTSKSRQNRDGPGRSTGTGWCTDFDPAYGKSGR